MQKTIAFYNWTDKEFTCEYDRELYTFRAGGMYNVPEDQAKHFAKHLTQLFMNTHGQETYTIDPMSDSFKVNYNKCFPNIKIAQAFDEIPMNQYDEVPSVTVEVPSIETPEVEEETEEVEVPVAKVKKNATAKKS